MLDEESLVKGIRVGDPDAIRQLFDQYGRLVLHMVARIVSEPSKQEDLYQEIFIKVYRNIARFKFKSKLSTWIGRIAYLSAVNEVKRQQRRREVGYPADISQRPLVADSPQEILLKKDWNQYLGMLINSLPLNYQMAVELYYRDGCTLQEISAITGLPAGTIKTYLFRARALLKGSILEYFKDQKT